MGGEDTSFAVCAIDSGQNPPDTTFASMPHYPVLACEMLDPALLGQGNEWSTMSSLHKPRMYHSVALLLPDGRLLSAGDQGDGEFQPSNAEGKTYEIYYPPYLFNSSGGYADRDSILTFPSSLECGQPFHIEMDDDASSITEVCLIAPTAITHANNMTQRRVLMDVEYAGGDSLAVTAPPNGRYAPPGMYMMFAIDEDGVPTTAKFVNLQKGSSVVQASQTKHWFGTVRLEEGFTVEEDATLIIEPGTKILANAQANPKVKIAIQGRVLADAGGGQQILCSSWNGPAPSGADWDGFAFELTACKRTGYGYAGIAQPPSTLENVKIENASYGIVLEDLGAPNLVDVVFEDITGDRHIFMKSDVVLPHGYWASGTCNSGTFTTSPGVWDLGGGTRVVASTTEFNDASWIGSTNLNDVLGYGRFLTDGSSAAGDQVFFCPDGTTAGAGGGRDWGGMLLAREAAGSVLRWADIGYAENPLFIFQADSLTQVKHTRVHHFADVGIWVDQSLGQGGVIDSCVVERGGGLHESLGATGVFIDQADQFALTASQVLMDGRNDDAGGTGIVVHFGKTFCQTNPAAHRTRVNAIRR